MINRTKIFTIALTGALAAVALTGCGGSPALRPLPPPFPPLLRNLPLPAPPHPCCGQLLENGSGSGRCFGALLEADPISNQFEIAAMNIEYDFGLQAEDVVSYKGVKSNDNGDAGLVLVLEAADGKAEDVANQLASYQQDQVAFYGNYAEFAQAQDNVENAVIAFKGHHCHGDRIQRVHCRSGQRRGQRTGRLNLDPPKAGAICGIGFFQ